MVTSTLFYLGIVLGSLAALMLGVRWLQRSNHVQPETARKIVHVGMGFICLPLPWWFSTALPVLILAGVTASVLVAVRYHPSTHRHFGSVLGGTGRASFGEFYYPIGVFAALVLCRGDRVAYCCGVGVLTFGDMAGAIVGGRFGRVHYSIAGNHKSVEGSMAVLLVSGAWVIAVVGATAIVPTPHALAGGLTIGAAAMALEAVARRGFDNVVLPFGVSALVLFWRNPTISASAVHLAMVIGLTSAIGFLAFSVIVIARARVRAVVPTDK